jgi:GT2 family glycosyltransferase
VAPKVATIILNWNLRDDLAECLESVAALTYPDVEVVVVDNASMDGSVEMVQGRFPAARLIVNEQNLGFARGNNSGLRYALAQGADYALLLNNDTVVAPDLLERLVAVAEAEPSLGIIGPKILYYGHQEKVWYLGHRIHRWLPVPMRVNSGRQKPWLEVDYVSGCGMLVRHDVLERVGLLDEALFMHYEDADYCRRAQAAGWRIGCVPGARMWHKVSRSSQHESGAVRWAKARNRVRFYRKYPHGPHPWLTAAFVLASGASIMARDLLAGRAGLLRPHIQGLYEGFSERLPNDA